MARVSFALNTEAASRGSRRSEGHTCSWRGGKTFLWLGSIGAARGLGIGQGYCGLAQFRGREVSLQAFGVCKQFD